MNPLAAILSGKEPVALIAILNTKTAMVVDEKGRVRVVRLSSLEVLSGFGVGSVGSARTDARASIQSRRSEARFRRLGAA